MDEIRDQMKEVNRFSFSVLDGKMITRVTVLQDSDGFYHIDDETIHPTESSERKGLVRKDIHGKMSKDAYISWLSNALFNACHVSAFDKTEKRWLMHD